MFTCNGHKIIMLPKKLVSNVVRIEDEFMNEMKVAEGLYVMAVKSLGIENIEER